MNKELINSYNDTNYIVDIHGTTLVLKVGERTPEEFEAIIDLKKSWAIITAHNPFSKEYSEAENQKRNGLLEKLLNAHGFKLFPAVGKGDKDSWKEEGFLIPNISYELAKAFGLCFQQNAIIFCDTQKQIELVMCKNDVL